MIESFQTLLNRLLNLNPHYLQYLEEIAGLSVAVDFTDIPLQFTFIAHQSFIEIQTGVHNPLLHLTGSTASFISFAAQKDRRQELLQQGSISFNGDLMVLSKLETFLAHFNFKWLAIFPIAKIKRFLENQVEYMQEERQVLASPILFDHLRDEILLCQQEIDRLIARLQKLEGQ